MRAHFCAPLGRSADPNRDTYILIYLSIKTSTKTIKMNKMSHIVFVFVCLIHEGIKRNKETKLNLPQCFCNCLLGNHDHHLHRCITSDKPLMRLHINCQKWRFSQNGGGIFGLRKLFSRFFCPTINFQFAVAFTLPSLLFALSSIVPQEPDPAKGRGLKSLFFQKV